MPDLFISYSSKNQKEADQIRQALELVDITCWIASRDIPAGADYAQVIPDAIDRADALLVLVSEHSQSSDHVTGELALAAAAQKPLIPYRLDQGPLTNNKFRYYLSSRNWVDGTGNRFEAMWEVAKEVKSIRLQKNPKNRTPEAIEAEKRVDQVAEVFVGLGTIIVLILLSTMADMALGMLPPELRWVLGARLALFAVFMVLIIRTAIWTVGGRQQTIRYLKELICDIIKNRKKERN